MAGYDAYSANQGLWLGAPASTGRDGWFVGKEFTTDYVTWLIDSWLTIISGHYGAFNDVLEIGSYEGRSTLVWLNAMPSARVTCIDTFAAHTEERFDRNLAEYAARIEKIKGTSAKALATFVEQKRRFDFIYVDGSHERDNVMIDSLLAWQLLAPSGILLFDDYAWEPERPMANRPQQAIDTFMMWHPEATILRKAYQVAVQKLA